MEGSAKWTPGYLRLLAAGELAERGARLEALLASCTVCPWDCQVNRLRNETKVCAAGYLPIVSSYGPHFGEEPALSGTHLPSEEARSIGFWHFTHIDISRTLPPTKT